MHVARRSLCTRCLQLSLPAAISLQLSGMAALLLTGRYEAAAAMLFVTLALALHPVWHLGSATAHACWMAYAASVVTSQRKRA